MHVQMRCSSPDCLLFVKDHPPAPITEFIIHGGSVLQTNSVGPEATFYPTSSIETGFCKHSVDVLLTEHFISADPFSSEAQRG